jgi:putative spermidine/putrescine transport system substrate-binding protein
MGHKGGVAMSKPFGNDSTSIKNKHLLTRRGFVSAAGTAAAALAMPGLASAQSKYSGQKVVFASWGGSYQDAQKVAFCEPFAKATGASVIQDGPVNYGKLRAMLESGKPTWDVVDVTIDFLYSGAADNLFEKIDTSTVNVKRIDPKYVHEYGIGDIVWSYNVGFSKTVLKDGKYPQTWADLFDLKKFPGRRMLRDRVSPMLEIALLADGVPPEKIYPIDVDRAFKKLDTIKKESIFWTTNSQSQQLLTDGEVGLGVIINGRAYDAVNKGANLGIAWDQHIASVDYLVVPKNAPNLKVAMGLIEQMTTKEAQAKVANLMALAPTNPEAFGLIEPKVQPWLTTNPAYKNKGMLVNENYWKANLKPLSERWTQWKLS